ncbi:MAG: PP2C family protein-serine/threonine phosphatase [Phycisphaerales bacterium JB060]
MAAPSVIVASTDACAAGPRARWQAVAQAFGDDAPTHKFVDVGDLADALIAQSETGADGGVQAVLVLLDEGTANATIIALANLLHDVSAFGFVLMPGMPEDVSNQISRGGLVGADSGLPDQAIATSLRALFGRQQSIADLQRELRILTSAQGGVRQEMDRMHEELNLAAVIQQELLPAALPEADGLECGVLYRPATYVSGDIYDVTRLDEDRLWFFVADAVGHGVPAALLTMVISRSLRSGAANRTPAQAMTALNADLVRTQRGRSRFATAVCGTFNLRTHEVTLCTAGHPPALIMGGSESQSFDSGGALLGVFEGEPYEQLTFRLQPGQTLLLYSDGFETAFTNGDEVRKGSAVGKLDVQAYLAEFANLPWLGSHDGASTAEAMRKLAERVDCQAGSLHQQDDLTAVAIALSPQARHGSQAA